MPSDTTSTQPTDLTIKKKKLIPSFAADGGNIFTLIGQGAVGLFILTVFVSCNGGSSYRASDWTDYGNPYYYGSIIGPLLSNKARDFNAKSVTPLNEEIAKTGGFKSIGGIPVGVDPASYGNPKPSKQSSPKTQVANNVVPEDYETQSSPSEEK